MELFDYAYTEKQILKLLSKDQIDLFERTNATLAGGALTSIISGQPVNDFDLYFSSKSDVELFINETHENELWFIGHTSKAATYRSGTNSVFNKTTNQNEPLKVQIIYGKYYQTHLDIFNDFDFTINMISYNFKNKRFNCDYKAIQHIASRKLVVNPRTRFPIVSMVRIGKYEGRGYTISKREVYKLALAISGLNMQSYDDVRDQLGSMYGVNLKDLFKDSGEFSIDNAIDAVDKFDFDKAENSFNTNAKEFKFEFMFGDHLELIKSLPLFKGVRDRDGGLFSDYKAFFEYKVGEIVVPHNPEHIGSGIYCSTRPSGCYMGNTLISLEPVDKSEVVKYSKFDDPILKSGAKVLHVIGSKSGKNNEELNEMVLDYLESFGYITNEQRHIVAAYFKF